MSGTRAYPCPEGHETVYQAFSGGRSWYCETCDEVGDYDYESIPEGQRPRAWLLTQPGGAAKLRAAMQEELRSRADTAGAVRGENVVCYANCYSCMFDCHFDPPQWHTWADSEDIEHARNTGQPDPSTSRCGCSCAVAPGSVGVSPEDTP